MRHLHPSSGHRTRQPSAFSGTFCFRRSTTDWPHSTTPGHASDPSDSRIARTALFGVPCSSVGAMLVVGSGSESTRRPGLHRAAARRPRGRRPDKMKCSITAAILLERLHRAPVKLSRLSERNLRYFAGRPPLGTICELCASEGRFDLHPACGAYLMGSELSLWRPCPCFCLSETKIATDSLQSQSHT